MIKVKQENGELTVLIGGNEAEITAAGEDYILAECSLSDLAK